LSASPAPPRHPAPLPYTTLFRSSRRPSATAIVIVSLWTSRPTYRFISFMCLSLVLVVLVTRHTHADRLSTRVTRVPHGQALLSRSEEHTSELQSRENLVCRLLLE